MEEAKRTLTRLGLHVNADAQAPICRRADCHCALSTTDSRVTAPLLENGTDINATDGDDQTSLHIVALRRHRAKVELLLERGADIDAKDAANRKKLSRSRVRSFYVEIVA